jgi:hypothetical protein
MIPAFPLQVLGALSHGIQVESLVGGVHAGWGKVLYQYHAIARPVRA